MFFSYFFPLFDTILLLLALQLLLTVLLCYLCSILSRTQLLFLFLFLSLTTWNISPFFLFFLSFHFLLPLCPQPYTDYYSQTRLLSSYIFRCQLCCITCDGSATYSIKLFFSIYIYSSFHHPTSYLSHYLSKTRHACLPIVYTSTFLFSFRTHLLFSPLTMPYLLLNGILSFSITTIHSDTVAHCITSLRFILYHHEHSSALSLSSCSYYYSACFLHASNSNYPVTTLQCCRCVIRPSFSVS